MITEQDLLEAIAECQGERNPNANTCIKLAAYYTILDHQFGKVEQLEPMHGYSYTPAEETTPIELVSLQSDSEFARTVEGMNPADVWSVMDELMRTLQIINPRLYQGVLRQLSG